MRSENFGQMSVTKPFDHHAAAIAVVGAVALAGMLTACGDAGTSGSDVTAAKASDTAVSAAGLDVGHVHVIALDGDTLLLGTHDGLYRQEPGQELVRSGEPFDVMGFAVAPGRWLASGHPDARTGGAADLGLLLSTDDGKKWRTVSLQGAADFHRLAVSGNTILGVNSGDGQLWRSVDSGATWSTQGAGPYDVTLDPSDELRAVATTQSGPQASSDGGRSFTALPDAPLIAYVAWTQNGITAVTPDGTLMRSGDAGASWRQVGSVAGQPAGLAAGVDRVVVLQGGTVWESIDGGATLTARITGLPG